MKRVCYGLVTVTLLVVCGWIYPALQTLDREAWLFKETDNLANLIGYIVAVGASLWAYSQWDDERKWKRKDVLMERIRAFEDTPGARNAGLMLTSCDRNVPLFDHDDPEERYQRVMRDEVTQALIPGDLVTYEFDPRSDAIRDSFEDFFGRLGHLEVYLRSQLLDDSDVAELMDFWASQLKDLKSGSTSDRKLFRNLCLFLEWRKMKGAQAFFARFGLNIKEDLEAFKTELSKELGSGTAADKAEASSSPPAVKVPGTR